MHAAARLLGVVMDPIEGIQPKKDSTLAMLAAAQKRGWGIVYLRQRIEAVHRGEDFAAFLRKQCFGRSAYGLAIVDDQYL